MFTLSTGTWTDIPDYPSAGSYTSFTHSLYIEEESAFYVIGGDSNSGQLATILKFDGVNWSAAGALNTARRAHRAIWTGAELIVAGGLGTRSSERCALNELSGTFECTDITPTLIDFSWGTGAFFVTDQYCR